MLSLETLFKYKDTDRVKELLYKGKNSRGCP